MNKTIFQIIMILNITFSTYLGAKIVNGSQEVESNIVCSREHLSIFVEANPNTLEQYPAEKTTDDHHEYCPKLEQTCCSVNQLYTLKNQIAALYTPLQKINDDIINLQADVVSNEEFYLSLIPNLNEIDQSECFTETEANNYKKYLKRIKNNYQTSSIKGLNVTFTNFFKFYSSLACNICSPKLSEYFVTSHDLHQSSSIEEDKLVNMLYDKENIGTLFAHLTEIYNKYDTFVMPLQFIAEKASCVLTGTDSVAVPGYYYASKLFTDSSECYDQFYDEDVENNQSQLEEEEEGFELTDECIEVFENAGNFTHTSVMDMFEKMLQGIHFLYDQVNKSKNNQSVTVLPSEIDKESTYEFEPFEIFPIYVTEQFPADHFLNMIISEEGGISGEGNDMKFIRTNYIVEKQPVLSKVNSNLKIENHDNQGNTPLSGEVAVQGKKNFLNESRINPDEVQANNSMLGRVKNNILGRLSKMEKKTPNSAYLITTMFIGLMSLML